MHLKADPIACPGMNEISIPALSMTSLVTTSISAAGVPWFDRLHPGSLRLLQHPVGGLHLGGGVAHHKGPRRVGAIAADPTPEIHNDGVASLDGPVSWGVVRRGGIRTGGDDGESGGVVALFNRPLRHRRGELTLGHPRELCCGEPLDHPIGGGGSGPQRADFLGVLRIRSCCVIGAAEVNLVSGRASCSPSTNTAQVWSPTATTLFPSSSSTTIEMGSSVSSQGRMPNTSGWGATRGASSRGTTSIATINREHQHCEPFGEESLVSGQVGEVSPTEATRASIPASARRLRIRLVRVA